jgi:hypothetical protein
MSNDHVDSDFDNDFDNDDELRAVLRGGDPAGFLPPADPAALASLLEDIMSADLDVRPAVEEGDRNTGTHGRNRLTWLVAAAAVAAIAAGGAFAANGTFASNDTVPQAGSKSSAAVPDVNAPVSGVTTALSVAPQQGRCMVATPELIAQYDQAFQGTVTSISGDTVTLQPTEVLNGEVGETVEVTAPSGLDTTLSTVSFQVGQDYLVAALNGQVSQCYSGSANGDLASPFSKAFVH